MLSSEDLVKHPDLFDVTRKVIELTEAAELTSWKDWDKRGSLVNRILDPTEPMDLDILAKLIEIDNPSYMDGQCGGC